MPPLCSGEFAHTRCAVVSAAHFVQIVCGIRQAAGVLWLNSAIKTVKSSITMRTQSNLCQFRRVLTVVSLLACSATDVFAQGAGKEAPAAGQNAALSPEYNLEIKDGALTWSGAKRKDNARSVPSTLENVVDLLRELHPEANFVVSPGLGSTSIADLKMRTSSVEEKLEAIRIAGGSQFVWRPAHPSAIDPATGLPAAPGNNPDKTLYVLDALPVTAKPGLQVEAFHLGEHFKYVYGGQALATNNDTRQKLIAEQMEQIELMVHQTVDEYRTISHASNISKTKSLQAPSIRFHRGANLVVIIGESEAVAVAAKVIGALPGAQRSVANTLGNNNHSQYDDEVIKRLQRDGVLPAPRR